MFFFSNKKEIDQLRYKNHHDIENKLLKYLKKNLKTKVMEVLNTI